jgi:tRNA pseudouridine38/39 synthase
MKEKEQHPVLKDLKIDGDGQISSSDILNYLLSTNSLPEEAVRSAVQSIAERHAASQKQQQQQQKQQLPQEKQLQEQQPQEQQPQKTRTRHIALRFYYDGANYSGLACNLGNETDNSVEKELFQALLLANLVESRESCEFSRCGRTDRGVSAVGQVVGIRLKSVIPEYATADPEGTVPISNEDLPKNEYSKINAWVYPKKKKKVDTSGQREEKEIAEYPYTRMLNNILSPQIRVLGWAPVSDEFSARFSASSRTYRYFFNKRQLSLQPIREGLALMVGKHDFRNFCKMDVEKVYNFERRIYAAEVVELSGSDICYIQIHGQAFLRHQIRCIARVLFMFGRGLEKPDVVTQLLDVQKYPGKPSYRLASDKPLVLHDCGYPNLKIGYSVHNIWMVSCQLEKKWEELTLAASQIRDCINSFHDVQVLKADLVDFATAKVTERQKKMERAGTSNGKSETIDLDVGDENSAIIQWDTALPWLRKLGMVADPAALNNHTHIPLMNRSRGTTFEEKLEALKKHDKKRKKYEEVVVRKRTTSKEDVEFYQHMAKQGGAGI